MAVELKQLAALARSANPKGVTSVCSAHPLVLRAALRFGASNDHTVLVEATCNQVNHRGGYTGMQPHDFARLVFGIAREESCPEHLIVLGGDHLGPNPWRDWPAEAAMAEAEKMVEAYVAAGFRKLHLDASMGCKGEPLALDDETTAHRAANLAAIAEKTAIKAGGAPPLYIIGTEVPAPGGADHVISTIDPTSPQAASHTLAVHRRVFAEAGLTEAFARAIGLVVQPGVEFGNHNVIIYDRDKATALINLLKQETQFVFEAHSTDYQGKAPLRYLVEDGFPILKVGPELTFVLREALYAMDHIASALVEGYGERPLYHAMEKLMVAKPQDWQRHYHGSNHNMRQLRHYSLSDRIRYYWAMPEAMAAVEKLFTSLTDRPIPMPLMAQYLPSQLIYADKKMKPQDIIINHVIQSLATYQKACTG